MITISYGDNYTQIEESMPLAEGWLSRRGYRHLRKGVWSKKTKGGLEYAYIRYN